MQQAAAGYISSLPPMLIPLVGLFYLPGWRLMAGSAKLADVATIII